ncbi:MAG: hypothetical protein NUW37_10300 [Planctomycetes bacterium]|nr:hypothetical protein [Planctomycetota bacterium]
MKGRYSMRCTYCGSENKGSNAYCVNCGKKIELSHDQVNDFAQEEIEKESQKSISETTGKLLSRTFFVFCLALLAYITSRMEISSIENVVLTPGAKLNLETRGVFSNDPGAKKSRGSAIVDFDPMKHQEEAVSPYSE